METTVENKKAKTGENGAQSAEPELTKDQSILQKQQANEGSDEEYLSDNEEVIDANDITQENNRTDLNMNLDNGDQKIWLVRLPRFLAERWRNKDNYNGQQIGKIKIKQSKPGETQQAGNGFNRNNNNAPQLKLELNKDDESFADIPHSYELNMTKPVVENQYVFNEQNLNNFNKEPAVKGEKDDDTLASEVGTPSNTNNNENNNDQNNDKKIALDSEAMNKSKPALKPLDKREAAMLRRRRRFNRYKNKDGTDKVIPFVKTIPKRTQLVGTIAHECQIIPSTDDPNYSKIIARRKVLVKEEPRPSVTLLTEIPGVTLSNAGLTLKSDTSKFLKSSTTNKNKGEGRAIRMPQKDLFDLLFKLFDEYDYWSLKGLKERTKQPEVYLKETLEQIAQLIKKGPYALKYALKREFKELKDQERAERLGELSKENEDDDEDEDNEEDVEMEDVI